MYNDNREDVSGDGYRTTKCFSSKVLPFSGRGLSLHTKLKLWQM